MTKVGLVSLMISFSVFAGESHSDSFVINDGHFLSEIESKNVSELSEKFKMLNSGFYLVYSCELKNENYECVQKYISESMVP